MKRLTIFLLTVVVMMSLAGCSQSESEILENYLINYEVKLNDLEKQLANTEYDDRHLLINEILELSSSICDAIRPLDYSEGIEKGKYCEGVFIYDLFRMSMHRNITWQKYAWYASDDISLPNNEYYEKLDELLKRYGIDINDYGIEPIDWENSVFCNSIKDKQ